MNNLNKLKRLLYEACIDYTAFDGVYPVIMINNLSGCFILLDKEGLRLYGCGYAGVWEYSAEYVVRMLDKKFREPYNEEGAVKHADDRKRRDNHHRSD